ncbi:thioredoxin family protein [Pseudomonas sp. HN11]|uniref:thioredoxin family protein n=1 Tax=Pseudomonas sp. HN11 TaxID=1344094 RepID=UPI001F3A2C02|nr:thioredoxin family protein [Pseudomonas sp. HN11]UII73985.1 thioredoxin family protein [Pseudomonas sp. HN11]
MSMNYVNAVIADKAAFERELETNQPVFVVFMSHDCAACSDAMPRFTRISERYKDHVKILILECVDTPPHPSVDRIPMLLIYHHQRLLEALPGLGEQALESAFEQYAHLPTVTPGAKAPGKPA